MADGEGHWDIFGEAMVNAVGGCGDWVLLDSFIRFLEGLNRIRRRHRSDRIIRVRPSKFPHLLRCWKTIILSHPHCLPFTLPQKLLQSLKYHVFLKFSFADVKKTLFFGISMTAAFPSYLKSYFNRYYIGASRNFLIIKNNHWTTDSL